MSNEEIVILHQIILLACFVVAFVALMIYKFQQQEKSIKEMFKTLPVIGFLIILWDDKFGS